MLNKILTILKYWSQIFLIPLYLLSNLMPRNKKIWLFGSTFGQRFADNPKYFYLYISQYRKDIRAIWISKNKEIVCLLKNNSLEAYYLYSLKGVWYSLRGKVYIYDNYSKDICFSLSGKAVKINLWHGIPLKKIQMDNLLDKVRHPDNTLERWKWKLRRMTDEKPSHFVLTTSEFLKPIFSSAFHTKKVLISLYPRNDIFISDLIHNVLAEDEKIYIKIMKQIRKAYKVVLYMPTFRESETEFFRVMDMKKFHEFLKKEKIYFFVKLHPKSKLQAHFYRLEYQNIVMIDSKADPYPALELADKLVTDYSSVYFDFLLTGREVIFFPYDYETYIRNERELYFNYEEFTPGIKVKNMENLQLALVNKLDFTVEYKNIRNKVFQNVNGVGSEQLCNHIDHILKEGTEKVS